MSVCLQGTDGYVSQHAIGQQGVRKGWEQGTCVTRGVYAPNMVNKLAAYILLEWSVVAGSLEAAYSLNWGAQKI